MTDQGKSTRVDLNESSVYADDKGSSDSNLPDDPATDTALDRLEAMTGGADEPVIAEGALGQKFDELEASTEEELDALEINLLQEDERPNARDGSGLIVDDAAEERIARFTESDPMRSTLGAASVEPGSDDTSAVLRRHHSNTSRPRSDSTVEGNIDEPMDETIAERKVDDGSAG